MDDRQRVHFPATPERFPWALALLTAIALTIVVVGEYLLRRDYLRPAADGVGLIRPIGIGIDAAVFGVVWCVVCLASLCCLVVCHGTLRDRSRTESRLLLLWALLVATGIALAMTPAPRADALSAQAQQRFVTIMAPTLAAAEAAAAKGQPADALRTDAVQARLRRLLPGLRDVRVLYQRPRRQYVWPGELVVITDTGGRVLWVQHAYKQDKDLTASWRGRPVAEIERLRGKATRSEVEFDVPWRLLVVRDHGALVHAAGQARSEYGVGPWIYQDVWKHRLLDWDHAIEQSASAH